MKYHCGHDGCDVCGARECDGTHLNRIADCKVCTVCISKAIRLAIQVSEQFSTRIDPGKPCKQVKTMGGKNE